MPSPQPASDAVAPEPKADPSVVAVAASYANHPEDDKDGAAYCDPQERTREINMLFQDQGADGPDETEMDPKTKMMMYIFGGVGGVVLLLMVVLGIIMIQPGGATDKTAEEMRKKVRDLDSTKIVVDPVHEWGCRLSGIQELEISCSKMLDQNSDGFTIETRIKIEDLSGLAAFEIQDLGSTPSFTLRCEPGDRENELVFSFEIPRLKTQCEQTLKIEDPKEWLYITAVWDMRRKPRGLRILVNGKILHRVATKARNVRLSSGGYKLIVKSDERSAVVIDEVRIRNRPFFSKPYTPETVFSRKKGTVSLVHFDKKAAGESFDEGSIGGKKLSVEKGSLVPVAANWLADKSIPAEAPMMIFSAIKRQQDAIRSNEFESKWAKYSAAEQKKFWDAYVTGKLPGASK